MLFLADARRADIFCIMHPEATDLSGRTAVGGLTHRLGEMLQLRGVWTSGGEAQVSCVRIDGQSLGV